MTRAALLQEALKLPHTERADVAAELLASLEATDQGALGEVVATPLLIEPEADQELKGLSGTTRNERASVSDSSTKLQ